MKVRSTPSSKRHSSVSSSDISTLRKELKLEIVLRQAAEADVEKLKDTIEKQKEQLRKYKDNRWETEEFLQNEIRRLEKEVANLNEVVEKINSQLSWFRENFLAANRSERDGVDSKPAEEVRSPEQAHQSNEESSGLCNSSSDESETPVNTPSGAPNEAPPKRPKGQQPGTKGPKRTDRSGLNESSEIIEKKGCACAKCGKAYRRLRVGKKSPLMELFFTLERIVYERCVYVPDCQCEDNKPITADPPPKLFPRTEIGNTIWVHLLSQKYLTGTPTNRTLKHLNLSCSLPLSQGTVTGGFKVIVEILDPLYKDLLNHCRGADFWNGDETWWSIYGKRWWMWLVASDDAVVYILDASRSKKVPNDFFMGSKGVFMTDRLASYKGLPDDIRKAWCWVHQRRDFLNVFKGIPKLKEWAQEWLLEITTLFLLTLKRFRLWEKDQTGKEFDEAQEELDAHVESLKRRYEEQLKLPGLHKKQKTILESVKRHWDGLTLFLTDPRIPLDNNRAERLLRNAVIVRKNCYGSGAEWSGHLAAKVFSIFQTWLINGLDPDALLLDYFNEYSKPGRAPPDTSLFLPWTMSEERKKQFALPKGYSRPG